jgi:hypothetical protein
MLAEGLGCAFHVLPTLASEALPDKAIRLVLMCRVHLKLDRHRVGTVSVEPRQTERKGCRLLNAYRPDQPRTGGSPPRYADPTASAAGLDDGSKSWILWRPEDASLVIHGAFCPLLSPDCREAHYILSSTLRMPGRDHLKSSPAALKLVHDSKNDVLSESGRYGLRCCASRTAATAARTASDCFS